MQARKQLAATLAGEAFASYLRVACDTLHLQQADLITRLNTGRYRLNMYPKDIWEYLNARRMPRGERLNALIEALELDPVRVEEAIGFGVRLLDTLLGEGCDTAHLGREALIQDARRFGAALITRRLSAQHALLDDTARRIPPAQIERALAILEQLNTKSPDRAEEFLQIGTLFTSRDR